MLRKLRNEFRDIQLTARGNTITLRGAASGVDLLERIFREMIAIIQKHGQLLESDIDTLINLALAPAPQLPPRQHDGDDIILSSPEHTVRARTDGQRRIVAEARNNDIVFAIGPAGTGKTYTAVAIAVAALKAKRVKRIVLARPAVEAGESLGFLPGDLAQKIDPYLRPLYDALQEMLTPEKLKLFLDQRTIEIVPLAYMRGRTMSQAFIILDEAQNASNKQMKMCLTRLGINSKAIITGDITQIDLPETLDSGLATSPEILKNIKGISFVYLDKRDVVRHKLVRDIIDAYEEHEHPEEAQLKNKANEDTE